MKKILAFLLILTSCQPLHIVLDDQTVQTGSRAIGWQNMNSKYDFKDSTEFVKPPEFEGGVKIGNDISGSDVVELDSVTTDGTNVYFYTGATILTAVPGVGSAAWGSISGTLTNQVDLNNALGLKANIASPTFTGTVGGITAAMVGAMSTSHAANVITGTNISNWNTAYGWGNHAGLYALVGSLAGYVPVTTTVNGHALSGNISVTASDVSLGNLTNKAQVELEDSINYVNGYMSRYDGVTGLALKVNIADTANMLADYINKADTASALLNYILDSEVSSTYLPIANPTATGTLTVPILKVNGGDASSTTITSIDSISKVTGATDISFYDGADTLNPYIPYAGRIDLYDAMDTTLVIATKYDLTDTIDLRTINSDTIPLFIFGTGSGATADTALFNNGRLIGAFFNSGSDTLQVTALRGVMKAGTGTETIAVQVSWDVNLLDGTPINLNTSAYTVTSMTGGDNDTSFNNNGIPPNVWVWGTISGASKDNKPTFLVVTLTGYKQNRSY